MTLQQLRYIIAVDRYRSFARAAEACGITQPTLSGMLSKLEDELDVRIFNRTNKSVEPTAIGARIIAQAAKTVAEADCVAEIVADAKGSVSGKFVMAVAPGIAPYILPRFIRHYMAEYPQVSLTIEEMKASTMLDALDVARIDAGIAVSGHVREGIFEIPLYTEKFMVYLAEDCSRRLPVFTPDDLEHENMWIMKDAQCLRDSAFSFCKGRAKGRRVYEAGNIETLINIVDENGGYTIIPEMHLPFLSEKRRANVRRIDGDYLSQRRVSMYIKDDYVRERMLNTVTDTLMRFMPEGMIESQIAKFGIKL